MSIWRDATGNHVRVCDMCGITPTGWFIHDAADFTQVDLTEEMLKLGFPQGTSLECQDICPACKAEAGVTP